MRVAIMGRSLRGRYSGVVRYTDELIRALAQRLGDELSIFVTRAPDGLQDVPARIVRAPFPTPNEYARALWEQAVVPMEVARIRPDVYHSPNYILPLALSCPSVVTVHDVAFLNPSLHRLRSHLYLTEMTRRALRAARRVICVSGYTRDRLLELFPAVADRVRVVSEGVDARFGPRGEEEVARFRQRFGIAAPYVLFVGTIEPRKNLDRLIRAFGRAVQERQLPHHLVVAGARGWKDGPVRRAHESSAVRQRIHLLGYVSDDDLPSAYSGAELFVYPSLEEGFGLPPIEAMACGTPVLTSNVTALPEVVGEAAMTVDPTDEDALAHCLALLLTDGGRRSRLRRCGLHRAATFRWDRVAEQTLRVYEEAVG